MRYSSRFFLYAPLLLLLALAGFVAAAWWKAADTLDARLKSLKGHDAVPGVTLDWRSAAISGFPFRLDVTFDGFSVKGAGAHGPFAWASDRFAVHALTYGAQKDVFEAAGPQHLAWTDAAGQAHALDFLPGALHASAIRDNRGLTRFDVDIVALAGKGLSIGRAQFHMRQSPDGKSIELMAEGDAVTGAGPLGGVKSVRTYQTLSQGAAFARLLRGEEAPAAAHAAWEAAGGRMTPTRTEINGQPTRRLDQMIATGQLLDAVY
jgi:hypothetical protein